MGWHNLFFLIFIHEWYTSGGGSLFWQCPHPNSLLRNLHAFARHKRPSKPFIRPFSASHSHFSREQKENLYYKALLWPTHTCQLLFEFVRPMRGQGKLAQRPFRGSKHISAKGLACFARPTKGQLKLPPPII